MSNYVRFLLTLLILTSSRLLFGQSATVKTKAITYIIENQGIFESEEIEGIDLYISSSHVSSISGISHIYYQQTLDGIDILNSVASVHLDKNEKIAHTTNRLTRISRYQKRSILTSDAASAVEVTANHFGLPKTRLTRSVKSLGAINRKEIFRNESYSKYEIESKLIYLAKNNLLILAWQVILDLNERHEKWAVYVDANQNKVIGEVPMYLECNFGSDDLCEKEPEARFHSGTDLSYTSIGEMMNNSYNVFAIPVEAPNEGGRSIVTEPWLDGHMASPFGWHDTDGIAGAEFTITNGNNVLAVEDTSGSNNGIYTPDGGAGLIFNFPQDLSMPPVTYLDASIVNLFYMNNIMHDVSYQYGFDVPAGNFQTNNYGILGGIAGDALIAEAQDGSDKNNARFFLSPDGGLSRMEMFEWVPSIGSATVTVNAPMAIAGMYHAAKSAGFGPQTANITGDIVLADHVEACTANPLINGAAINGNIALIDRANCNFTEKVINAQDAGAIGVIICNNIPGEGVFGMGGSDTTITIPSLMISYEDCQIIRVEVNNGLNANLDLVDQANTDSGLDNGIIAHEYAHGISTRLTGGPGTAGCLGGDEQMGEGWSDYFALMLQLKPGDLGEDRNGIGTFVLGDSPTGNGIRPFPYSTDLNVNPFTYNDISAVSAPHGVGSVWCTMLWDMTWNLIEKHGYEPDVYAATGGNGIAMQLVMEGLKLQPCLPGFVDGRDAILAADTLLFGGVNACEIWRAFARRGLGVGADQGDVSNASDGTESYLRPPGCPDELIQPCTEEILTYNGVSIADGTVERVNTSITIVNSNIQPGSNVMLRAAQNIDISPLFTVEGTGELFLKAVPCDDSSLPFSSQESQLKGKNIWPIKSAGNEY